MSSPMDGIVRESAQKVKGNLARLRFAADLPHWPQLCKSDYGPGETCAQPLTSFCSLQTSLLFVKSRLQ